MILRFNLQLYVLCRLLDIAINAPESWQLIFKFLFRGVTVRRSKKCIYHDYENHTLANKLFETIVNECNPPGNASCPHRELKSRSRRKPVYFEMSKHRATSITTRGKMTICEKWWESIQSGVYLSDRFFFLSLSLLLLSQ